MINFYDKIVADPVYHRQLRCGDTLITRYNCPLENQYQDIWSHLNYIAYVVEGRKVWHTAHGSYDLRKGSCVFVQKGAVIVEQFFDAEFCIVLFFISDEFICEVLRNKSGVIRMSDKRYQTVMPVNSSGLLEAFYYSMMPYFGNVREPDPSILELKFRELILNVADDPANHEIHAFFNSLLKRPRNVSLQKIMEDNFCFNLKLEEYAVLTHRSLSAFKRDFQKQFNCTPGKWLMEKRLNHAMHLLTNTDTSVSQAAFESGFESPSHFSRSFRRHFGISPASARQKISA